MPENPSGRSAPHIKKLHEALATLREALLDRSSKLNHDVEKKWHTAVKKRAAVIRTLLVDSKKEWAAAGITRADLLCHRALPTNEAVEKLVEGYSEANFSAKKQMERSPPPWLRGVQKAQNEFLTKAVHILVSLELIIRRIEKGA